MRASEEGREREREMQRKSEEERARERARRREREREEKKMVAVLAGFLSMHVQLSLGEWPCLVDR